MACMWLCAWASWLAARAPIVIGRGPIGSRRCAICRLLSNSPAVPGDDGIPGEGALFSEEVLNEIKKRDYSLLRPYYRPALWAGGPADCAPSSTTLGGECYGGRDFQFRHPLCRLSTYSARRGDYAGLWYRLPRGEKNPDLFFRLNDNFVEYGIARNQYRLSVWAVCLYRSAGL